MKSSFGVITTCALLLLSGHSFAQKCFDFGISSGLQTSTLINQADQAAGPELDFKQKTAVPFGLSAGYSFSRHLGVEVNLILAREGQSYRGIVKPSNDPKLFLYDIYRMASMDNIAMGGTYSADVVLNVTKIPLLLRYTGNIDKKAWFHSFIGPQLNMLRSATFYVNGKEAALTGLGVKPVALYNKNTIAAVLGLGAGIKLAGNLSLTADLRLEYGLSDIENKNATITAGGIAQKYYADGRGGNHSASGGLMLGLHYRLFKEEYPTYKGHKQYRKYR